MKYSSNIIEKSKLFTDNVENKLKNLGNFSEAALEWITLEHYQFSFNNPSFLSTAANLTEQLRNKSITQELHRNLAEEKDHSKMYKEALAAIGTYVEKHVEFLPTTCFFKVIRETVNMCPSSALGTMYAIEATSVFEHEIFRKISKEIIQRRDLKKEGKKLIDFHDLHLSGVEQSHRDELGVFVDLEEDTLETGSNERINKEVMLSASNKVLDAMSTWWGTLLDKIESPEFMENDDTLQSNDVRLYKVV